MKFRMIILLFLLFPGCGSSYIVNHVIQSTDGKTTVVTMLEGCDTLIINENLEQFSFKGGRPAAISSTGKTICLTDFYRGLGAFSIIRKDYNYHVEKLSLPPNSMSDFLVIDQIIAQDDSVYIKYRDTNNKKKYIKYLIKNKSFKCFTNREWNKLPQNEPLSEFSRTTKGSYCIKKYKLHNGCTIENKISYYKPNELIFIKGCKKIIIKENYWKYLNKLDKNTGFFRACP